MNHPHENVDGLPIGPQVDAAQAPLPGRVTLQGAYVDLVPLDPLGHGESLFTATCGPAQDPLWLYLFDASYADRQSFDRALRSKADSADPFYFAIIDRGSACPLGWAALMRIEPAHRVIEVGSILYSPALQRTRGATEAMYLLARYVFEVAGLPALRMEVQRAERAVGPRRSQAGFHLRGHFQAAHAREGTNRDTAWFSMLDREWPARKAAFQRWLRPENFDADGRQRQSLESCAG